MRNEASEGSDEANEFATHMFIFALCGKELKLLALECLGLGI